MFKLTRKTFYIILFSILWLITAFSSFFHAVEFFELSNVTWMGIILALAFEIGQASVLMSILTSAQDRKKYTPWILMCILTLVQIIGNVYSSYKYIMLNSPENLKYFKEPIFIWTQLPDAEATVIITYVSAAILPIVALLMTSMITNYLSDNDKTNYLSDNDKNNLTDQSEEQKLLDNKNEIVLEDNKEDLNAELNEKDEEIDNLKKELEQLKNDKIQFDEEENKSNNDDGKWDVETSGSETTTESGVSTDSDYTDIKENQGTDKSDNGTPELNSEQEKIESINKENNEIQNPSHFINL